MISSIEDWLSLVYIALDEVNVMRPPNEQIPKSPNIRLAGDDGDLDSLGLTMLVLALEEQIRQKTGKVFSLVNDSSFSELGDTFSSPLNLAMFIKTKFKDD